MSEVDQIAHGGRFQITSQVDESFHINLVDHIVDLAMRSIRDLTPEQSLSVKKLLMDFQDIFPKGDFDLGLFKGIQHRMNTGDALPVKSKLRRTPLSFQTEEEEHLKSMLDKGIIVPSASDRSSAPVLVRKKDGTVRYCIDFRGVNKVTKTDAFSAPKHGGMPRHMKTPS